MALSEDVARRFARAALGHVAREYPNSPGHVLGSDADAKTPRALHPAFFGSYDWHSCVHGWWTLLTLRRMHPAMPEAAEIAALAEATFTPDKLAAELAYFERAESRGFERPYGWGWLLALHGESGRHGDATWAVRLEPLARALAERFVQYLRVLTYPITVGTHFNTAFALTLARDWAESRDPLLLATGDEWAMAAFGQRQGYAGWEPGGDEFLSPVLTAALLMSRVMPASAFEPWVEGLVLANGWVERECRPVTVSDRSDGKIAHLDGLNLSRAWCLWEIAARLPQHPDAPLLHARAEAHYDAAIPHVTGDYMGEHWLASFALLAALARSRA
ncbi:DUF2891 domain-containing protein [Erythrobacter sp.]|uniref:DUF2891 domain-containing protein n=1 Tax=Erythrobacter sp. TaxID=1042 RepID=UPI001425ECDC|nr:DUF2891 domain-containing protein [Erythrobacter sp.]QIQ87112.1 MAG: DUF2891 domain-containing protein [Erythrobacter sp.]